MEPAYMTVRDTTLTHQVHFSNRKGNTLISCNCRRRETVNFSQAHSYAPIGVTKDLEESRRLYNDPANHWAPFSEGDKAKW